MPSKSMSKNSNHDFKVKYPYVPVGTLEPMHIKGILTNSRFFAIYASVLEYKSKIHNDIKLAMITVVELSLHSLKMSLEYQTEKVTLLCN